MRKTFCVLLAIALTGSVSLAQKPVIDQKSESPQPNTQKVKPKQSSTDAGPSDRSMESRLKAFLERFPKSDLNQDGKLTREEVRQFNTKRREAQGNRVSDRPRPKPTAADYAYGDHEKQRFDLWSIPGAKAPTPLVIFIHGGGFRGGDKRAFNPATITQYREKGIAFASMNYRLSDVGPYPIMMHDAARGLQTIRHLAEKWNIDPNRIACYGGSAGAGISLWLAFHNDMAKPDSDDPVERQSTRISAAATINGQSTYDLNTFREWFGVPELKPHEAMEKLYAIENEADWKSQRVADLMKDASPITHLSHDDDAPVYMTYNRGDVPVTAKTDQGVWVHHYRLGMKLNEAMEKLGKECHVVARGDRRTDVEYASIEDFLVDKLKAK